MTSRVRYSNRAIVAAITPALILLAAGCQPNTGSLSGSVDNGNSSTQTSTTTTTSTPDPGQPASGEWATDSLHYTMPEGSTRSIGLTWNPKGSPTGALAANISGTLSDIAVIDAAAGVESDAGTVEFPLLITMPASSRDSYSGAVQLADARGQIGPPLTITVETDFADAFHIPSDFTPPSIDRIITFQDYPQISDELLVWVDPANNPDTVIREVASSTGSVIYGADPSLGIYEIRFRDRTPDYIESLKPSIESHPGVAQVTNNYIAKLDSVPNDPMNKPVGKAPNLEWVSDNEANWGLRQIQASRAWDLLGNGGDPNVIVGIIDAGPIYSRHEDLSANMSRSPMNSYSGRTEDHSTHVAGIACATGNNGVGITGAAQRCDLRDFSGTPTNGIMPLNYLVRNMTSAAKAGAKVVNISWGFAPFEYFSGPDDYDCVADTFGDRRGRDEIRRSLASVVRDSPDTLWVAAAGNECADATDHFPAALAADPDPTVADRVVSVGATTRDSNWAPYSNFGEAVTIVAPGGTMDGPAEDQVLSTVSRCKNNLSTWFQRVCESTYRSDAGTSMAAPYVTGTAALALSAYPNARPERVKQCLEDDSSTDSIEISPPRSGDPTVHLLSAHSTITCILQYQLKIPGANNYITAVTVDSFGGIFVGDETGNIFAASSKGKDWHRLISVDPSTPSQRIIRDLIVDNENNLSVLSTDGRYGFEIRTYQEGETIPFRTISFPDWGWDGNSVYLGVDPLGNIYMTYGPARGIFKIPAESTSATYHPTDLTQNLIRMDTKYPDSTVESGAVFNEGHDLFASISNELEGTIVRIPAGSDIDDSQPYLTRGSFIGNIAIDKKGTLAAISYLGNSFGRTDPTIILIPQDDESTIEVSVPNLHTMVDLAFTANSEIIVVDDGRLILMDSRLLKPR